VFDVPTRQVEGDASHASKVPQPQARAHDGTGLSLEWGFRVPRFAAGSESGGERGRGHGRREKRLDQSSNLENKLMKHKIGMLVMAVAICAFGFGCKNTAHGVGKDVENVGEKIQEKTD
jgi:predicted small secreted protein